MPHFLVIYDRSAGELVRMTRYAASGNAMEARFRAEAEFRGCSEIEIVALAAGSEEDLRRTHARYFMDLHELAARMS